MKVFFEAQKQDYRRCLHSSLDCERPAIRAHSIQNSRVLDLVQDKGHVVMPRPRIRNVRPTIQFEHIGRSEASTFTGLCAEHDAELFKPIDTEPLNLKNSTHLTLLAYRSVMRELHTTIEAADRMMHVHDILVRSRAFRADALTAPKIAALEFLKKAHNVFRYRGKYFDTPMEVGKQVDLVHSVLELPNQAPVIAASSLFSTAHSEAGDIIGPTLNIIPMDEKTTAVILSCPSEQAESVEAALAHVCRAEDDQLRHAISKLIIQRVENFVLSPAHFASWSDDKRARILAEYERSWSHPAEIGDHPDLMLF